MLKNVHTPTGNIFICDKSEQSVGSTYLGEMLWVCSTPGISSVLRGICRYSGFSSPFVYSHKAFYNLHMSIVQWTPRHIWAFAVQEGRLFDLTILLSGEVSLAFRCILL